MEFRSLSIDDAQELENALARMRTKDIHADPRYLKLFAEYTGQEPIYLHGAGKEGEFLIPFFKRPLPDIGSGAQFDLMAPWYYGGPLHSFGSNDAAALEYPAFLAAIDTYAKQHGVISQFQRLNPALDNHELYGDDVGLSFNRKVVAVDLAKDIETIRSEYEYKARKNIRRAKEGGLTLVRGVDKKTIQDFIILYTASMDRKQTGAFYYFNEEFYQKLFSWFPDELELFTAYAGDAPAVSAIVLGNGIILHDYLRAADPAYMNLRPSDFVVDAIIEWAKGRGYQLYSVGGGHSMDPDDTLLRFKRSFSPLLKDYYLYRKVHDRAAYAARCQEEGMTDLLFEDANPFPEYRVQ